MGTELISVRATVNDWLSRKFPIHRRHLVQSKPQQIKGDWLISLHAYSKGKRSSPLGTVRLNAEGRLSETPKIETVSSGVTDFLHGSVNNESVPVPTVTKGKGYEFGLGDGVAASERFDDLSIPLLLTDPPYGISHPYNCEKQVSRRLRKDGTDFIMPRGAFGEWDGEMRPRDWVDVVLPKVKGWAITFCAQAQIGEYVELFRSHGLVAVGTLVWQKTNPVPFNHRYKPINAWEAAVIGKRPGTKFYGGVTHNVFVCKSPSPQERIHSTQKPLALMCKFIRLFSAEGEVVFDPFAGSATSVIAAASERRIGVGYELSEDIYQKARKRIVDKLGGV